MKGETEIEMSIVLLWEKAFPGTLVQWLALSHCYWLDIFSKQQSALWPKSIHSKIDQNKTKSYQKKSNDLQLSGAHASKGILSQVVSGSFLKTVFGRVSHSFTGLLEHT